MEAYLADVEALAADLKSNTECGLTESAAAALLEKNGPNELAKEKKTPLWIRFFQQMADPMVIMLIVAAVISAVAGAVQHEADFADVIIIMCVVIINSTLGVVQEAKSEEALEALQKMSAATSRVLRDGVLTVLPSAELVVGDIVLLEAGDSVPADCRVVESHSMKVEEASLTGESVPVEKSTHVLAEPGGGSKVPLGDRSNMCYMGSVVVYGRGRAMVTATGMDTEMGNIAGALAQSKEELTPLQVKLAQLSKILSILVIAICVVVFAADVLRHGALMLDEPTMILDTFMVAVALAVAAIPEGLVAVVTIVLSLGVTRMSRRNAIIRRLSAVETLGCTQIICTDKTGTLTQNKMTVTARYAVADPKDLLRGMALASDAMIDKGADHAVGEPTECALAEDAWNNVGASVWDNVRRVAELPFDSSRKMMTVIVVDEAAGNGKADYIQYTKGAPDVVIGRCTRIFEDGRIVPISQSHLDRIRQEHDSMTARALRVLALACRCYQEIPAEISSEALEQDLIFVGLSGMSDPVRPEVKDAIHKAEGAGIIPVMITGDHKDTAMAIGRELDILREEQLALTGSELSALSDTELEEKLDQIRVYARVQPEHKTRIVDAWKRLGKVVAMTGDGVNDAPSIKRADIGVGMGITGTDVTKSVADMVLADDNFATIIGAVEEGRRIYDNIRKVIQFLLSANLAEVCSVFFASLVGFTIFQPVQLLWINLVTDCFPALALGMEGPEGDVMARRPRDTTDGVFAGGMGLDCAVQGLMITVLVLISFCLGVYFDTGYVSIAALIAGVADKEGVTCAFVTLSMVEIFHSFNMRSRRASLFSMKQQNLWLWGSAALALFLTLVVVEVDTLAGMFGFVELPFAALASALGLAFLIIPLVEIYKALMRLHNGKKDRI